MCGPIGECAIRSETIVKLQDNVCRHPSNENEDRCALTSNTEWSAESLSAERGSRGRIGWMSCTSIPLVPYVLFCALASISCRHSIQWYRYLLLIGFCIRVVADANAIYVWGFVPLCSLSIV